MRANRRSKLRAPRPRPSKHRHNKPPSRRLRVRQQPPSLKDVRGTNFCDLYATFDGRTGRSITIAVIDNLVKGAAGQAIQNLNLMHGLPETTGLAAVALQP